MKNFNLFSGIYGRKLLGFLAVLAIDYVIYPAFDSDFKMFLFLLLNGFFFYYIMEFASYGSQEYVSIDFRSDMEKEEDELKRKQELLSGAVNNLIMETSMGNISNKQLTERLDNLELIGNYLSKGNLLNSGNQHIEANFLEIPKNNKYV